MYLLHSTTNTVISASISTDFQTHSVWFADWLQTW